MDIGQADPQPSAARTPYTHCANANRTRRSAFSRSASRDTDGDGTWFDQGTAARIYGSGLFGGLAPGGNPSCPSSPAFHASHSATTTRTPMQYITRLAVAGAVPIGARCRGIGLPGPEHGITNGASTSPCRRSSCCTDKAAHAGGSSTKLIEVARWRSGLCPDAGVARLAGGPPQDQQVGVAYSGSRPPPGAFRILCHGTVTPVGVRSGVIKLSGTRGEWIWQLHDLVLLRWQTHSQSCVCSVWLGKRIPSARVLQRSGHRSTFWYPAYAVAHLVETTISAHHAHPAIVLS